MPRGINFESFGIVLGGEEMFIHRELRHLLYLCLLAVWSALSNLLLQEGNSSKCGGLCANGCVHAVVDMVTTHKLGSKGELAKHFDKHLVPEKDCPYKRIFAYEFADVRALEKPVPYCHQQGARRWVNIQLPTTAQKAHAKCFEVANETSAPKLQDFGNQGYLKIYDKSNCPYVKVNPAYPNAPVWKFYYIDGYLHTQREAIVKGLHLSWKIAQVEDQYSCLSAQSIRELAKQMNLTTAGVVPDVCGRVIGAVLKHYNSELLKDVDSAMASDLYGLKGDGVLVGLALSGAGGQQDESKLQSVEDDKAKKAESEGKGSQGKEWRVSHGYLVTASVDGAA